MLLREISEGIAVGPDWSTAGSSCAVFVITIDDDDSSETATPTWADLPVRLSRSETRCCGGAGADCCDGGGGAGAARCGSGGDADADCCDAVITRDWGAGVTGSGLGVSPDNPNAAISTRPLRNMSGDSNRVFPHAIVLPVASLMSRSV